MERASYYQKYGTIRSLILSVLTHAPFPRNKVKLQAYQREYSRQKRAPGLRKVSKKERVLLEEQWIQKHQLMEMEGLPTYPKAAFVQYVCYPFCHFTLTQKARAYACTLIVRSQEVDPRRTLAMIQAEEQAREYFKETKDILQLFCLCGWIDHFQKCVQDFIQERLAEAANIMAAPGNEEEDCVRLHSLRRLVAGAVQEEELVRQPDHAAACAKLDRAIVWDGRRYVIKLVHHFSALTHLPRINLRKFRQRYGW